MVLRSDEEANLAEIERDQKFRNNVKKGVSTAVTLGGAATSGGILSKVGSKLMPFLNENLPVDLAIKGISKINPKVGDFLKRGMESGLNAQDGLNFLRENLQKPPETQKEEPNKQKTTEQTNIIRQYSDELYSFLDEKIKQGKDLFLAGASAQINPKFASVIEKMENDHKTNWSDILTTVFGQKQTKQQPQQQQQQAPQPNNQARDQKKTQLMELLNNLNKSLQG